MNISSVLDMRLSPTVMHDIVADLKNTGMIKISLTTREFQCDPLKTKQVHTCIVYKKVFSWVLTFILSLKSAITINDLL